MTLSLEAIEQRLQRVLRSVIGDTHTPSGIPLDLPLTKAGLALDSVAQLELVVAVEAAFGIALNEQVLDRDRFQSLRSLARLVHEEMQA